MSKRHIVLPTSDGNTCAGKCSTATDTGAGRAGLSISSAGLAIERANHVWCADITYNPVQRGFLYLVAIMDYRPIARLRNRPLDLTRFIGAYRLE